MTSRVWFAVEPRSYDIRRIIYKCLNVCPMDYTAFAVSGKVMIPLTGLIIPVWCFVNPTECPRSVHNRCVIEVFGGVFVLSRCFYDFSAGVGLLGLSQISSFLSPCYFDSIKQII